MKARSHGIPRMTIRIIIVLEMQKHAKSAHLALCIVFPPQCIITFVFSAIEKACSSFQFGTLHSESLGFVCFDDFIE